MHRTNIPGTVRAKANLRTSYSLLETRFEISAPRIPFVVWTSEKEEKKKHKFNNEPAKNQIDIKCIFWKNIIYISIYQYTAKAKLRASFPEENKKKYSEVFKLLLNVDWLFGLYAASTVSQSFNGD